MRQTLPTIFAAVVLVAFVSCADNILNGKGDFSLSGTVVDAFSSDPISGAVVRATVFGEGASEDYVDTTDASGAYGFDTIDPRRIILRADYDAYCPYYKNIHEPTDARVDVDLDKNAPTVFGGLLRLDSIKVSCDDRPANYTYQYKCRLEDKEVFHSIEYLAFYFTMEYRLHYAYPEAVNGQTAFLSLTFGDNHTTSAGISDYVDNYWSENVFYWDFAGLPLEARIPGEELQNASFEDLQTEFRVAYTYEECGLSEQLREGETLLEVDLIRE